MAGLSRRQALMLLASLGGLSLLPAVQSPFAAESPAALARFNESLNAEVAARLGRDYLERHAKDVNAERLLSALFAGSESSTDMAWFLSHKVCDDFTAGRVIDLHDWQVSETEARIFAAIALTD